METRHVVGALVATLTKHRTIRKATAFLGVKETVVLARREKPSARQRTESYVLTIGRPNAVNRVRIALLRKAGEPFPVKKFKLDYFKGR